MKEVLSSKLSTQQEKLDFLTYHLKAGHTLYTREGRDSSQFSFALDNVCYVTNYGGYGLEIWFSGISRMGWIIGSYQTLSIVPLSHKEFFDYLDGVVG